MAKVTKEKIPTEARILEAAHKVFLAKGFSAATVRDVAKEAKTNVASVNYYFRSKQKLFNEVMMNTIQQLLSVVIPIAINPNTTVDEKIDKIVDSYIEFLTRNPDLPTFIVSEFGKKNVELVSTFRVNKDVILQSALMKQFGNAAGNTNPLQLFMCLIGIVVFPFVMRPVLIQSGMIDEKAFLEMMKERKGLASLWMKSILNLK